jgi:hypothetical protein
MKRIVVAMMAAAGVAVAAGSAQADPGGFVPPTRGAGMTIPAGPSEGPSSLNPDYGAPPPPGRYGVLPCLKRLAFWRGDCDDCGTGWGWGFGFGKKKVRVSDPAPTGPVTPYAPATQGTLVFPNHPFVRSPRDYFMEGPSR